MKKKTRMALYTISLVITLVLLGLLLFHQKIFRPAGSFDKEEQISTEKEQNTQEKQEHQSRADTGEETEETMQIEETEEETTTLVFAGDVLIAAAMEQYYDKEGVSRLVSGELLEEMVNADICMVNHEFQFSTRGTPMEDKQFTFRTDPEYVQILKDLGVDIVSLANNHALDFGTEALQDTFETLDAAEILYAGAGNTKERAKELQIIEVNGMKYGFLAATRVIPVYEWNVDSRQPGMFSAYDDSDLVKQIEVAQGACDFLTVYIHWGIERNEYPEDYQTVIAKHCIAAGADLIIGAHPHVLQRIEFIDGKPVFYSLGNYIFSQTIAKTALVKVEIQADKTVSYQVIPAYAKDGKTQLAESAEAEALFAYLSKISPNAQLDGQGMVSETE